MATSVKVVATDLKTATVKVNPNDHLTDVLEQACKKLGLSSDKFQLKHKQKTIDLSSTFRLSGLPQGAKLELVAKSKSPSVISVALDITTQQEQALVGSQRVTGKFPSDYTLWKILRYFESETCKGKGLNLTQRGVAQMTNGNASGSGQLYYETPVLLMENRRTFSTFGDFQKTLSQLGYNTGNVRIRLSFEKINMTLADAMGNITDYFKDEEQEQTQEQKQTEAFSKIELGPAPLASEPSPAPAPQDSASSGASQTPIITPSESSGAAQPDPTPMEIDFGPASSDPLAPSEIFMAPSSSTPVATQRTESDEAYTFDIAHAQKHQQLLQEAGRNKRLLSDAEIEQKKAAEAAKLSAITSVKVQVKFPDETSAAWSFGADADGAYLYKAVRLAMVSESAPFKLITPGTRATIEEDGRKLVKEYKMTGPTKIVLIWDDAMVNQMAGKPVLKNSVAKLAKDIVVPEIPEVVDDAPATSSAPKPSEKPKDHSSGRSGGFKGMPKWFKGTKK